MKLSQVIKAGIVSVGLLSLLQGCLVLGTINTQDKKIERQQQQYFAEHTDYTIPSGEYSIRT